MEILEQFNATFKVLENATNNLGFMQNEVLSHRTIAVYEFFQAQTIGNMG